MKFQLHVIVVVALAAAACADKDKVVTGGTMIDDFGDTAVVASPPQRIVSLNPTTTELLFALGAGSRVVGRTTWDVWPDSARLVQDLGPGIRPNVEAILGAKPDLVILYASLDNRAASRRLRAAGVNTISLKIDLVADFYRATEMIGRVTGDTAMARVITDSVARSIDRVRTATAGLPTPTVFWHIWDAPPITIGRGSYMHELTTIAGARNIYSDLASPSPAISIEDVVARNPDFVLAGPEGTAKMSAHPQWKQVRAVRERRMLVLDTLVIARPGVRLGEAAVSLARLVHPGALK